jgi:hypothetical protein
MPQFTSIEQKIVPSGQTAGARVSPGIIAPKIQADQAVSAGIRKIGQTAGAFAEKMVVAKENTDVANGVTQFREGMANQLLDFEKSNDFNSFEKTFDEKVETLNSSILGGNISGRARRRLELQLNDMASRSRIEAQSIFNQKQVDHFRASYGVNRESAINGQDLGEAKRLTEQAFEDDVINEAERDLHLREKEENVNFFFTREEVLGDLENAEDIISTSGLNDKNKKILESESKEKIFKDVAVRRDELNASLAEMLNLDAFSPADYLKHVELASEANLHGEPIFSRTQISNMKTVGINQEKQLNKDRKAEKKAARAETDAAVLREKKRIKDIETAQSEHYDELYNHIGYVLRRPKEFPDVNPAQIKAFLWEIAAFQSDQGGFLTRKKLPETLALIDSISAGEDVDVNKVITTGEDYLDTEYKSVMGGPREGRSLDDMKAELEAAEVAFNSAKDQKEANEFRDQAIKIRREIAETRNIVDDALETYARENPNSPPEKTKLFLDGVMFSESQRSSFRQTTARPISLPPGATPQFSSFFNPISFERQKGVKGIEPPSKEDAARTRTAEEQREIKELRKQEIKEIQDEFDALTLENDPITIRSVLSDLKTKIGDLVK